MGLSVSGEGFRGVRSRWRSLCAATWAARSLSASSSLSAQVFNVVCSSSCLFCSVSCIDSDQSFNIPILTLGVYAGDPSKLSMRAAFGKVWRLEENGGSIIGGTIKAIQDRRKNPKPPRDP